MSMFRKALFPFSIAYDAITRTKNFLYNSKVLKSAVFEIPVIVIGNLSTGGTGKTPHTEYIANLAKKVNKTAVLSRGYGRKTKGYLLANSNSTSAEIGDEPLQISSNISDIDVAVCEDRATGIHKLMESRGTKIVVLDDAFQHRKITGSLYILLTTFSHPFYQDLVLPAGNLRETKQNKNRADIIVVSKCPSHLSSTEKEEILKNISPTPHQQVFFTQIEYATPKCLTGNLDFSNFSKVLLVTGIVQSQPLVNHLRSLGKEVHEKKYSDHFNYQKSDINDIIKYIKKLGKKCAIVTTSKDAVKLHPLFLKMKTTVSVFEIPIQVSFLFDEENQFNKLISSHVKRN